MLSKKRGFVFTTIITLLSFISVAYFSCTKTGSNPLSCDGIYCDNGGHCNLGRCICPAGYEGLYCSTPSASKFVGTWDLTQKITGSDSANVIGKDSSYVLFLKKSATPTTFMMNNFYGNANYNNIICTIDSTVTSNFIVDTLTPFHMLWNQIRVLPGSWGTVSANDSLITMNLIVRHLTATSNWQKDTLLVKLTPHKF